jgi:hypothetical protein
MNHAIELCGGGDNDPFRPGGSGSKPTASPSSQSQTPGSFPQSNNSSQASAPVTSTAPAAQSIPFSQPANQTAQEGAQPNWCASSAQVSYVGDSLDANEDIQLWFSLSEGHTDRFRGISVYYTVRYSCYQRGPYTKEDQAVEHLDRGEDHKSLKELFIAHECPLPDHGYPHVERVEITRINCN